jgi:molybdopterin molybdotransferase
MREMIAPREAQSILFDIAQPRETLVLPLHSALGYVASEDVRSVHDIPPFTNSAMDGFAVFSSDLSEVTENKPKRLKVIETVAAGGVPSRSIQPGSCIEIMTGALLPRGADSVVMVENTKKENDEVLVFRKVLPGANVRAQGEDVSKGDVILEKGSLLDSARIGLLAATGTPKISVYAKVKVGIVITGNELILPGSQLMPGKIFNSNGFILFSMVREAGAIPVEFGIVSDEREKLIEVVREARSSCDVLISSGGVSAGKFDFVEEVLEKDDWEFLFSSIQQKPGKPMVAARRMSKFFFGLPGNPVSVMVCFELYVRPFLRKKMGISPFTRKWVKGNFAAPYLHKSSRTEWVRVKLHTEGRRVILTPFHYQGSGIIRSMVYADGLAEIPASTGTVSPKDEVNVYLLKEMQTF